MTTIQEDFYTYLSAHASLSSVGTRIYPLELPQGPTYPAIVYRQVSTRPLMYHGGASGLRFKGFQFDCYGSTYNQAATTASALRTVLNGYQGTMDSVEVEAVLLQNESDDFGDQVEKKRVSLDFLFIYKA